LLEVRMSSYRVSFYNELSNSRGQMFKVFQRSVEVPFARSLERAVARAKKKFEEEEGVGFWGHRARTFEIERVRAAEREGADER
jgi:hypothetical protein